MPPVDVVHFNPVRRRPGLIGRVLPGRPLNNFGDLLGPIIVEEVARHFNLTTEPSADHRLVAVGSIMHFARPGDVVWGAGVNGKELHVSAAPHLDMRAVRGPRTRDFLRALDVDVPEVYGDPALLWSSFHDPNKYLAAGVMHEITVVPNFHDTRTARGRHVVSSIGDPQKIIAEIAASKFVCGSSLHGIIIAESFGIPARLILPGTEPSFKYDDYYAGTGRPEYQAARSVSEAIDMGGEPPIEFNPEPLLNAFPIDLWSK